MHNLFRFLLVLAFVSPTVLFANEPQEEEVLATEADHESPKSETEAISEFVVHHTFDSYEFHFFTIGDSHYGFSLPIILWDNGLQVFSSSHFHHGEAVAESNGNFYKIEHNKIYKQMQRVRSLMMNTANLQMLNQWIFQLRKMYLALCLLPC